MKKILFLAIGILTSVNILAETGTYVDKGLTYEYDTTTGVATLIKGPSTQVTEVEIPATITLDNDSVFFVKTIGMDAFKDNTSIIEVIIANGIETINESAFWGCSQLKKITLPSTLGTIKSGAFNSCARLTHIRCLVDSASALSPEKLPTNPMMTLYVAEGKKASFDKSVSWTNIFGNRIYEGEMREVLYDGMWYICASISKKATLFTGKDKEEVVIPDSNIIEDEYGVKYTVTGIDREAFYGFSNIKKLTIPKEVTAIGPNAFYNCSSLAHVWCKVVNPDSLSPEYLPNNGMMTLYVPEGSSYNQKTGWKSKFGSRIYEGDMVEELDNGMTYICATGSKKATLYSGKNESYIIVPRTIKNDVYDVTGIDRRAFYDPNNASKFSKLTTLIIGDSISAFGQEAFKNCNIANIFCNSKKTFSINDDVFSNKSKATLYYSNSGLKDVAGWNNFSRYVECNDMEEFVDGGMTYVAWTKKDDSKVAKLTKGIAGSSETPLIIPQKVKSNTYNVVAVAESAFKDLGVFTTLTISNDIDSIGPNAFRGCKNLKTITLPSSLKVISENAFYDCNNLTSIEYSGTPIIETIGESAFKNCKGMKTISLPSSLKLIGNNAFAGCSNLVEVESNIGDNDIFTFPSTAFPDDNMILYIKSGTKQEYANKGWNSSKFLHIFKGTRKEDSQNNLTYVYTDDDNEAVLFSSKTDNTNASIEPTIQTTKTVTAIAKLAFAENKDLISVTFANSISKIGKYAFKNCSKLNGLTLPTSLKSIGEYAFENNTSLTSITIPEGCYTIRQYAFKKCTKLEELVLPQSLEYIGDYAFYESDLLSSITSHIPASSLFVLKDYVFSPYIVPTVYIDPGLETATAYKTKDGWKRFKNNYKSGSYGDGFAEDNDYTYMKFRYYTGDNTATLITVNSTGTTEDIIIPNIVTIGGTQYTVTDIGEGAFQTNPQKTNVKKLTISEGIKTIGANAFQGCSGLTSVSLPDSLTAIARYAFEGNSSLVSLTIPNKVETIGAYAFKGCSGLTRIDLPTSLNSIGDNAFENNLKLDSLIIPEGVKTIGMYAFKNWSKLNRVNLPSTLEKIDEYAFSECPKITIITSKIDSLFRIEDNVFLTTSSTSTVYQNATLFVPIDTVTVNGNVDKYKDTDGWKLFDKIIEGEKKTIDIDLAGVGKMTYEYLTGLKTATLTGSVIATATDLSIEGTVTIDTVKYTVTAIGNDAFKGKTTLTNLVISDSIKTIGTSAFEGCTALKKVKLSSKLTTSGSIGQYAFKNCPLTHICSKSKTPPTINDNVFSNSTATLFVPQGSNYSIEGWTKFSNVVEGELMDVQSKDGMDFDCLRNGNKMTAILTKYKTPANTSGPLEIPNSVTFNSVKYEVTTIGKSAFSGITSFDKLTIKEGVKVIEASAFLKCSNMKEVVLPSTLGSIGDNAFDQCNNIVKVTSGITKSNLFKINENVFTETVRNNTNTILYVPIDSYTADATAAEYRKKEGWNFLTIIEGKKGLMTVEQDGVGKMTYEYLTGPETAILTGVDLDDIYTLTVLGSVKIGNYPNKFKVTAIGDNVFKGKSHIKTLVVSDNVERIGTNAFQGCSGLERIELPSTLDGIGEKAFDGCKSLVYVCSKDKTPYDIYSNVFPSNTTATLFVPKGKKDSYEKLTTSGWSHFKNIVEGYFVDEKKLEDDMTYYFLEDVEGNGVTRRALLKKSETTTDNVVIKDSVELNNKAYKVTIIGESAFKDNSKLAYLTIPETVDSIGNKAFNGCDKIENIVCKVKEPINISDSVFSSYTSALYVPKDSKIKYQTDSIWRKFNPIYGGNKKDYTLKLKNDSIILNFDYATGDTIAILVSASTTAGTVSIPETITIDSINYPIKVIGKSAFKDNTALTYLTIPETVDSIGNNAFEGCDKIENIVCKLKEPIRISDNVFSSYSAALYVPSDTIHGISREKYQKAAYWQNFKPIYEGEKKEHTYNKDEGITLNLDYATGDTIAILVKATTTVGTVNIPDTVTIDSINYPIKVIGKSAFKDNTALTYLTIPETIDSIGNNAFEGCDKIENIISKIKTPSGINDNVFSVYSTAALYVPGDTINGITRKKYQDADGWKNFKIMYEGDRKIESYGNMKYACATGDKTAVLLSSTTTAKDVIIPDAFPIIAGNDTVQYKVIKISESAFNGNSTVKNLTIPESIDFIGDNAFNGCDSLVNVVCKVKKPIKISENVFSSYNATLYVPKDSKSDYQKDDVWKKFSPIYGGERKLYTLENDGVTFDFEYATGDQTAVLVTAKSIAKKVIIPDTILVDKVKYAVIAINDSVFKNNESMESLKISEGIKTIGAYAFQGCKYLKRLELPSTLTDIGVQAFDSCNVITHLCSKIKKPTVLNSNVFSKYSATLFVPDGTTGAEDIAGTYKGENGWKKFSKIVEGYLVDVPTLDGFTYNCLINGEGETVTRNAIMIKAETTSADVIIPDTIKIEGDSIYYKVIAIEKDVFKGNTSIEYLKIGTYVKSIGDNAFNGCKNILNIECKVKEPIKISENVFSKYSTALYVPKESKTKYQSDDVWKKFNPIYGGERKVYTLEDKGMTFDYATGDKTAVLVKASTTTKDVIIPSTFTVDNDTIKYKVITIANSAFKNNPDILNLTIPESIDSISDNAFNGCKKIVNVVCKVKEPIKISENVFSTYNAALYVPNDSKTKYQTAAVWNKFNVIYGGEKEKYQLVKDSITFDFEYATGDKTAILVKATTAAKDITIPGTFAIDSLQYKVIAINDTAFINNQTMESLMIEENIKIIGSKAFQSCTNLKRIEIPSTLDSIANKAFDGCKSITHVCTNIKTPKAFNKIVFSTYTATLFVPQGTTDSYNIDGWNNFSKVVEGYLVDVYTSDDDMTFDCVRNGEGETVTTTAILSKATTTAQDVIIPDNVIVDSVQYKVVAIDNSVFKSKGSIVNLKIPENVQTVGASAFQSCGKLKKVWLPSTLTSIGEKAFDGCNALTHICTMGKTPLDIEDVFSTYSATLYVPDGTKDSYKGNNIWNQFPIINEGYLVDVNTQDKISYECMIKGDGATATNVAILISSATTSSDVAIPDSISLDDVYYKVKAISDSAFIRNTKLANLTIPEHVDSIGVNAFNGCNNIANIICKVKEPININDSVFTTYTASLYVPEGSKSKYQEAEGWKNFANIYEGERGEYTLDDLKMTFVYAKVEKTAILSKTTTTAKEVVIPDSFAVGDEYYKVIAIDKNVFKGKTSIVNLTLPSTLTKIGENAFNGCNNIVNIISKAKEPININDSVFSASIFSTAKVYVPTGTSSEYKTTEGWKNFTNIIEGEMKTVVVNDMTYTCILGPNIASLTKSSTSAAEVTISATVTDGENTYNVTEIDSYAFSGIGTLEKVTINDGINSIGIGAFQNCNKLKEVVIPASVTSIGDYAFDKCSRLALVVSHIENPFAVSDNVFPDYIAKLNIPIGTTDLYKAAEGWNTFTAILEGDMLEKEVDGMTYFYVTGPRTATLIKGSTDKKELTIPSTVTIDGVEYSVKAIDESALANVSSIEKLYISEGIETIGASAFKNCAYLNLVSLPSTLTSIGDNAFNKCGRLVHVQSSLNSPFGISDNVFPTEIYTNATLYVPVNTTGLYSEAIGWKNFTSVLEGDITEVTIDGMTYICVPNLKIAKVTKGLANTKEVTIPSTISVDGVSYQVTAIERSAFFGFGSLEKLVVSEGVKTIGMTAFKNCSKLKSVELPASLVSISDYAFDGCSRLTTVVCSGKEPAAISDNVFSSTSITVNVPVGAIETYLADANWGKFNILDSMSFVTEGDTKNEEDDAATYQITTKDGDEDNPTVAIINDDKVSGSFAIPETVEHNGTTYTVTAIAPSTFENNTTLIEITIPSTIIAIGESAFAGCTNLKSITVNIPIPLDLSAPAAVRGLMTRSGGNSVFEGVDKKTCILYVPEGSVSLYKVAPIWCDFQNIISIQSSNINGIVVTDGVPYDVYNMQGLIVRYNTTTLKGLAPGIYIVNGKKIVIRK